jgi:hypothetical protein
VKDFAGFIEPKVRPHGLAIVAPIIERHAIRLLHQCMDCELVVQLELGMPASFFALQCFVAGNEAVRATKKPPVCSSQTGGSLPSGFMGALRPRL